MADDFGQSAGQSGAVSPGGSVSGSLEQNGDRDWFALTLGAGQSVQINLDGVSLPDPFLRVYDSAGSLLTYNDDANGYDSQLSYTALSDETIYIEAGAWNDAYSGTYTVTVAETDAPSPLAALDWQGQVATSQIEVFFAPSGYVSADGVTSEGFTQHELAQFQLAFNTIESVANLHFTTTLDAASADFILVLDADGELASTTLGYFYPPNTVHAGLGVFNGAAWDRDGSTGELSPGGNGLGTVVHELLHGLGFAHPHDAGGNSDVMLGVASSFGDYGNADLNQGIYTTMSYNPGFHAGPVGTATNSYNYGTEIGPMALDIGLLQQKYGANLTNAAGDDVYVLPDGNTVGTGWLAIWDTGGTDEVRYGGTRDAFIDLRAATLTYAEGGGGFVSAASGIMGGVTIAAGVTIENGTGGAGNDTLTGNEAGNRLDGSSGDDFVDAGTGDDTVIGGSGADTLVGGLGEDLLDYSGAATAIRVDLAAGTASLGDAAGDVISGFEHLFGGNGGDVLVGTDGANVLAGGFGADTLSGGSGDDTLEGGYGNDVITGGAGRDRAVYEGFGGAINVNLNIQAAQYTGGGGEDILIGIEDLQGGAYNDRLIGLASDSGLFGGAGSDRLYGLGGDDTLHGEAGNDCLIGGSGNDTLWGGDGRDVLLGGADDDLLMGGDGGGTLRGEAGCDTIQGGEGRDVLVGGSYVGGAYNGDGDADVFVYTNVAQSTDAGRDVIRDFEQGIDKIDLYGIDANTATSGDDGFLVIGLARFSGTAGELRSFVVGGNTIVQADVDGDGMSDFSIQLIGEMTMGADDFIL